jgi:D-alanine-D-alanine ligase
MSNFPACSPPYASTLIDPPYGPLPALDVGPKPPCKVAVLYGGWSLERAVSLVSGQAAFEALTRLGHKVTLIDVPRHLPDLLKSLEACQAEIVFNALHGEGGEDGLVQSVLDLLNLPYTHSGRLASALAMDKPMTLRLMASVGIAIPDGAVMTRGMLRQKGSPYPLPYVIKPAAQGSSVNVFIVQKPPAHSPWLEGADDEILLIERYIPGRELTVGILAETPLAVTEIRFTHDFFDYEAKYTKGASTQLIPAPIPAEIAARAGEIALSAHRLLGCKGISRSDLRWNEELGLEGLYFLEINTQPGLTPTSLVPSQALWRGLSFDALCAFLLARATCHP